MQVNLKEKYGKYAKYFVADALSRGENECVGFEPTVLKAMLDSIQRGTWDNGSAEADVNQLNELLAIVCGLLEVSIVDAQLLKSDESIRNIFAAAFNFYSREKIKEALAPVKPVMVLRD